MLHTYLIKRGAETDEFSSEISVNTSTTIDRVETQLIGLGESTQTTATTIRKIQEQVENNLRQCQEA